MRSFLNKIIRLLRYWYYWILDYTYIGLWQLRAPFRRGNIKHLLQPSWKPGNKQIILLPGIYEHWEFMNPIAHALLAAKYSVHVIEGLGYNASTVEEAAKKVEQYVVDHDLKNCVIVAHSKGGLIGKYLLSFSNEKQRFRGLVSLNTPFGGSRYAYVLPFASLRVFAPTSPLLTLLAKEEAVNAHIYSLYSIFDPHIPNGSALVGAHNIQLSTYGHFRPVKDPVVHTEVIKAVEALFTHASTP
jgi:pimeloyl-ACP methyl ester carboxylesterase